MTFIDGTVVNVALPALQASLNATITDVQWVVEAYTLFLSALILVGGSMGDQFGRKRVFHAARGDRAVHRRGLRVWFPARNVRRGNSGSGGSRIRRRNQRPTLSRVPTVICARTATGKRSSR
jgi:Major Facilitator Superfamily